MELFLIYLFTMLAVVVVLFSATTTAFLGALALILSPFLFAILAFIVLLFGIIAPVLWAFDVHPLFGLAMFALMIYICQRFQNFCKTTNIKWLRAR